MRFYDKDVFGMIKDGILEHDYPYSILNWIEALRGWKDEMGEEFIEKIVDALVDEKWDEFKDGLLEFIERYGYGESEEYDKLSRCTYDYIAGSFDYRVMFSDHEDKFVRVTYDWEHRMGEDEHDLYDEDKAMDYMVERFKEKMWGVYGEKAEYSVYDFWRREKYSHVVCYFDGKVEIVK